MFQTFKCPIHVGPYSHTPLIATFTNVDAVPNLNPPPPPSRSLLILLKQLRISIFNKKLE
jgi:hypothetical protein